jgi:hypothetical protein
LFLITASNVSCPYPVLAASYSNSNAPLGPLSSARRTVFPAPVEKLSIVWSWPPLVWVLSGVLTHAHSVFGAEKLLMGLEERNGGEPRIKAELGLGNRCSILLSYGTN